MDKISVKIPGNDPIYDIVSNNTDYPINRMLKYKKGKKRVIFKQLPK